MLPDCGFRQGTHLEQGHVNWEPKETEISGMFFRFCMDLFRGHSCELDYFSSSYLSFSERVLSLVFTPY